MIAAGIERIVKETVKICGEMNVITPQIIILAPPLIDESQAHPPYRMQGALEKSQQFAQYYAEVAKRNNTVCINLAEHITSSPIDGIHLDPEAHPQIAKLIKQTIHDLEP